MRRALLWLLIGLLLFLLVVGVTAPGLLGGRALALGLAPIVPAAIVALVLWDVRRRSNVYGGHVPDDPGDDRTPPDPAKGS